MPLSLRLVLAILFVVDMFLWFLTMLPVRQVEPYGWASSWLVFIAVLILALFYFVPSLRQ